MPQMMPMNWLMMPMLMFFIMMLIFINMSFSFLLMSPKIKKISSLKKNKTWMW